MHVRIFALNNVSKKFLVYNKIFHNNILNKFYVEYFNKHVVRSNFIGIILQRQMPLKQETKRNGKHIYYNNRINKMQEKLKEQLFISSNISELKLRIPVILSIQIVEYNFHNFQHYNSLGLYSSKFRFDFCPFGTQLEQYLRNL